VITIQGKGADGFINAAMAGRVWKREPAE